MEFLEFPKMARLTRECVITEKIDGTNAQIAIDEFGSMFVGSRHRWLSDGVDNFGFYAWAMANRDELLKLGPGRHYGEWWGNGIQRGYGLPKGEKRFSLFNTSRWNTENVPVCCAVVPVLYSGLFGPAHADNMIAKLANEGSVAAPGFMDPEGIVIYHVAAGNYFKKTIKQDESPKSRVRVAEPSSV